MQHSNDSTALRLHQFIVEAKENTYVGNGENAPSSRPASHDLTYQKAGFTYLDSYFGGTDFCGQEVVWYEEKPIWAMNYRGTILEHALIDGARAGEVIKAALSALYKEGRFLGGWRFEHRNGLYEDKNDGNFQDFSGLETISVDSVIAYRLHYHGGLITP